MHSRRVLLIGFLTALPFAVSARQTAQTVARTQALVKQLGSSDPSVRGASKLELMRTADPDVLAALVEQASGAKGELRTNLIEILGIYKDPRQIPALIQMSRPFESEY